MVDIVGHAFGVLSLVLGFAAPVAGKRWGYPSGRNEDQ